MRNTAQDRAGFDMTDDDIEASADSANGLAQPNVVGNVPSRRLPRLPIDDGLPLTVTTLTGERHEAYVAFTEAAAELDRAQVALNEAQTAARAAFDRLRKSTTLP
jgi:hypothetical protein